MTSIDRAKYDDVARQAVGAWRIDCQEIQFVSRSENVSYRVTSRENIDYVLRFHRPGYHDIDELISEHVWIDALRDRDIPCPQYLLTPRGEHYTSVAIDGTNHYAGLALWVAGEPLGQAIDEQKNSIEVSCRFRSLGRILGQFHTQATEWHPPTGFKRQVLDSEGFFGDKPFWGRFWEIDGSSRAQRNKLSRFRIECLERLAALAKTNELFSVIHADLHMWNLIVNENDLHVIDFDDCGFGWHAYDLAVALGPQFDYVDYESIESLVLEGYEDVRTMPRITREYIPLFLVIRSLAHIGWMAARPEHRRHLNLDSQLAHIERIRKYAKLT